MNHSDNTRLTAWPLVNSKRPHFLAYLLGLAMAALMLQAAADQQTTCADCPTILIDPQAFSSEERQLIWEGATSARDFFESHGVDLKETIRVETRKADYSGEFPHIGSYSLRKNTIKMLSLKRSLGRSADYRLFRLPLDEALYRSIAVHEVAHAIADQNFAMPNPSLVAHEYLAYVAQLSTMGNHLREKVLRNFELSAYESVEEMSWVYYEMAPACFGVKAYLHFRTLDDPSDFIRGLLSGKTIPAGPETE